MILHTWGDFSTQIQCKEEGTKSGITSFIIFMLPTSYEKYYTLLSPWVWTLLLFWFGENYLYRWLWIEKDLIRWETLTISMQPYDYEYGKGLLNTPNCWLSGCTSPTCIFWLASILITPLSIKSYMILWRALQSCVRWPSTLW